MIEIQNRKQITWGVGVKMERVWCSRGGGGVWGRGSSGMRVGGGGVDGRNGGGGCGCLEEDRSGCARLGGGVVNLEPPLTMILRGLVGFNLFKLAKNLWWLISSLSFDSSPSSSTAFESLCFSVSSLSLFTTAFKTKQNKKTDPSAKKSYYIGRKCWIRRNKVIENLTGSVTPIDKFDDVTSRRRRSSLV